MDFMDSLRVETQDMINNTANRVPVCIVVDTSFSMMIDDRIGHVNKGIQSFINNSVADEYAVDSIELCIIAFSGENAIVVHPFTNVAKLKNAFKPLPANGQTPLGKAVELGLKEIDTVLKQYSAQGVTTFKPWLIIMSDGEATDDVKKVAGIVREQLAARRIKVKCIDMGDGSGRSDLGMFTNDGEVDTIQSFQIEDFFMILSRSAVALSVNSPGEDYMTPIM